MTEYCKGIKDLIDKYLVENLNGQESIHLKNHLKACSNCCANFDEEKNLLAELRGLPELSCPMDVTNRIEKMAKETENVTPLFERIKRVRFLRPSLSQLTVAAGATILAITCMIILFLPSVKGRKNKVEYSHREVIEVKNKITWSLGHTAKLIRKNQLDATIGILAEELPKIRNSVVNSVPILKEVDHEEQKLDSGRGSAFNLMHRGSGRGC